MIINVKTISTKKKFMIKMLKYCLFIVLTFLCTPDVLSQQYLQINAQIKDALTKRDLSTERYITKIEIFRGSDTTLVERSVNKSFLLQQPQGTYFFRFAVLDVNDCKFNADEESDDLEE